MNILSFDIEEWYLEKHFFGNRQDEYRQYDFYLGKILDKLDERGIKATFFCLGGIAREFPDVVKAIAGRGHEVGCHSDVHSWLNRLTREELMSDTKRAVDSLEDVLGKKVLSYRAPAFTIGDANRYAFEVLAECGIERDASVFPAVHSIGGFERFSEKTPCIINVDSACIQEFPICTTSILGKSFAYSGGGYFRFFPLSFIKGQMSKNEYNMTYFHIGDLVKSAPVDKKTFEDYFNIPATWKNRTIRDLKSNIGKSYAFEKLSIFIDLFDFTNLEFAASQIDWSSRSVVKL